MKRITQHSRNQTTPLFPPFARGDTGGCKKTFRKKKFLLGNTIITTYFFVSMMFLILNNHIQADSIWKKRITLNTNLFSDNRARGIGDIVTVLISESTEISGTEDSSAESSNSHSINLDTSNFLTRVKDISGYLPNITADTSHDFSGKGDYESNRNINLELTAVVTEILANGNLIIEGNRDVNINSEKYNIKLSGIVRPIDINIDNEVQSTSIANANITLEGKGFLTRAGKRGWWNRIREVVWPF